MAPAPQLNFLDHPKTDHHIQIMVLCIILGMVIVGAWLYTVLIAPTPVPVAVTPVTVPVVHHLTPEEQVMAALNHPPATTATAEEVMSIANKIATPAKTTATAAQKQAILDSFNKH